MKILITGGNSSVSRNLIPLLSDDYEIITVGRRDCDINLDPEKHFTEQLPDEVDIVIHTAAAFGRQTDEEIYETQKFNVLDTMELCFHLKKMKVKHYVYISSIFAHLEEGSPLYSIYSISKRQSEEIIAYCLNRDKIPFTILRPSQLYGNDPSFIPHHPFLYQIIETASKGEKITLFGTQGGSANYLHIKDFTQTIARVVRKGVYGVYDSITESPNTYLEIAKTVYELTDNEVNIEFLKDRKESGQGFPFDDTIYNKIGFFPQMSIRDGLSEILNKN